jgi:cell division protein FtsI (penicillin-binding protein 3)
MSLWISLSGRFRRGRRTIKPRRQSKSTQVQPCTPLQGASGRRDNRLHAALETGRTRLLIGGAVMMMGFGVVGLRLIDIALLQEAREPRVARAPSASEMRTGRADIVDRNGEIVATSLQTASLFANPRKILDANDAARLLVGVLPDLKEAEVAAKLKSGRGFVWLKRNLSPRQQWNVIGLGIPGVEFQTGETRVYPHGPLAAHILGYVGVDGDGLAGVEKSFDTALRSNATTVQLTIDIRLQHLLRSELMRAMSSSRAIGATGVIFDVRKGEVLAMTSLPDYDPNIQNRASDDQRFNRATLGVYELGSTFKIFTTAMALDYGVVNVSDGYDATKPLRVARFTIRDFHAKKRWLSVPEIFMYSSNIGAAKMARDVGGEGQREFLSRLGMLRPASIELPEVGAPMQPKPWRPINTMTIGFGHGLAVSPLQLTAGVAAVVNGGVFVRPTLIRPDDAQQEGAASAEAAPKQAMRGERVMSTETSMEMRRMMRLVVEKGTGGKAGAIGYLVGGKTGTAEKSSRRGYNRRALISSFIGAFPMNDPRYVVLALVDEPQGNKHTHGYATGGWIAAPVVRRIVQRAAPFLGISPVDESDPAIKQLLDIDIKPEGRRLASY